MFVGIGLNPEVGTFDMCAMPSDEDEGTVTIAVGVGRDIALVLLPGEDVGASTTKLVSVALPAVTLLRMLDNETDGKAKPAGLTSKGSIVAPICHSRRV